MNKITGLSTCEYITIAEQPFKQKQKQRIENVLIGGLGGGTVIRHFQKYASIDKSIDIDVIESDHNVIQYARQNFIGPDGKNSMELDEQGLYVNIIHGDFIDYITHAESQYDYIFIDCFYDPTSKRLYQQHNIISKCYQLLNSDGMLCINIFPDKIFNNYLLQQCVKIFNQVKFISCITEDNKIIMCTK